MAIKNSLIFGGVSSADYGIFIGGEGVFDAPKRAVEMVDVPGRNGAIAIDLGRYENITVEYPVFVPARSKKEFRSKLSEFVNAIASQKGYQRLSDTYHPGEYRMGHFAEQIEVDPVRYNTAGGFRLIFNCKPQRFLTSGEQEISVSSGDTLINPTLFEAGPLLKVWGYGNIEFNGHVISSIDNGVMGNVILWDKGSPEAVFISTSGSGITRTRTIPSGVLNTGDSFTIDSLTFTSINGAGANVEVTAGSASVSHSGISDAMVSGTVVNTAYNIVTFTLNVTIPAIDFVYGTPKSVTDTENYSATYTISGSAPRTRTFSRTVSISYDGVETIAINWTAGGEGSNLYFTIPEGNGYSTINVMGHPTYIDCDLGEVYKIESGNLVSLNAYIDLGSDLPTLAPRANEITYDNTITELKVVPKWWKV